VPVPPTGWATQPCHPHCCSLQVGGLGEAARPERTAMGQGSPQSHPTDTSASPTAHLCAHHPPKVDLCTARQRGAHLPDERKDGACGCSPQLGVAHPQRNTHTCEVAGGTKGAGSGSGVCNNGHGWWFGIGWNGAVSLSSVVEVVIACKVGEVQCGKFKTQCAVGSVSRPTQKYHQFSVWQYVLTEKGTKLIACCS